MIFIGCLKFFAMGILILGFLAQQSTLRLLFRWEEFFLSFAKKNLVLYCRMAQKILNIKVNFEKSTGGSTPGLIVANHLSYVDVLILGSSHPALFITSQEIRETFLLGKICELAGCFFVERRREKMTPGTKATEMAIMRKHLGHGHSVFLFPEGTSSDGSTVLPFKATFFQLAVDGKLSISPVVLNYLGESQKFVPWYGSMTFADHLFKLCTLKKIEVSVKELAFIQGENKFELAEQTCQLIRQNYLASRIDSSASKDPVHPSVIPLLD